MTRGIIIPVIALSAHGGTRVLVEFANFAVARGEDVELLLPKGMNSGTYQIDARVKIRQVPVSSGLKFLDYFLFLLLLPFYFRQRLVVANFFVTYFPAKFSNFLFGTPFLYFVQDIEDVYTGLTGGVLNIACRLTYRSRRIVAANAYLRGELEGRGARPLAEIQLGPSSAFYAPARPDSEKLFDIVCFPRHELRKGVGRLEKVLSSYRRRFGPLRVLAISQDPDMLSRFEALGFTGARPQNEVALVDCMDQAKVLLFTSYKDGFGLPPLEGMARGLPAVVYACGGPSLYMQDGGNGFLIDNDDERAVACLHTLLTDAVLYETTRRNALQTAAQFSLGAGLASLLEICRAAGR